MPSLVPTGSPSKLIQPTNPEQRNQATSSPSEGWFFFLQDKQIVQFTSQQDTCQHVGRNRLKLEARLKALSELHQPSKLKERLQESRQNTHKPEKSCWDIIAQVDKIVFYRTWEHWQRKKRPNKEEWGGYKKKRNQLLQPNIKAQL